MFQLRDPQEQEIVHPTMKVSFLMIEIETLKKNIKKETVEVN